MTVTPLCNKLARLSLSPNNEATVRRNRAPSTRVCHNSPDIFSSALRPLFPDRTQSVVIRARACPARSPREIALLKVRPFRLAPKNRRTRPVEFENVKRPSAADTTSLSEDGAIKHRIFEDPHLLNALEKHQWKKLMRSRRISKLFRPRVQQPLVYYNTTPAASPTITSDRLVPVPSIPFNEETDIDPYMLFPEKQWPFSALKEDSRRYREEKEAALEAKAQRWLRVRPGCEMTVEEWKDMFQKTYNLGKYASPPRQSISCMAYSPMDIDG